MGLRAKILRSKTVSEMQFDFVSIITGTTQYSSSSVLVYRTRFVVLLVCACVSSAILGLAGGVLCAQIS